MTIHKINDAEEAQAIAREFADMHDIDAKGPVEVARVWFRTGTFTNAVRETLTVDALYSKLTKDFVRQGT